MSTSEAEWVLLKKVQQMDFVVVEFTLYTDTHPNDEEARKQWERTQ